MPIHYREGTTADLDALQKLGLIAYGQFQSALTEGNWQQLASFLTASENYSALLSTSTCFVAEQNDALIGMAFLVPSGNPTDIFQADWSYVRMVGVHPAHGGKGIGKQLMHNCIEHARSHEETTVALHTSEFMDTARYMYEKMGFVQVKAIEPRYGKKYWLYLLPLVP